jgi:hypothetical protein
VKTLRAPIALANNRGRSIPVNPSRLVNFYAQPNPEGSRTPATLFGTPGMKAWCSGLGAPIRAVRYVGKLGYVYALAGTTLYRIDSTGTATACTGATLPSSGTAMLSDNGVQVCLLVDGAGFIITGTTIVAITSADFNPASSVDFVDGYFVFTRLDSGQFFISGLYDGLLYDASEFATAESSPDNLLRVLVDHREVWLFGAQTTEAWINTGASPFPFERVSGAVLERGIAAGATAAKADNGVFWLGDDLIVYRAAGYQPARISTHAEEEILRTSTTSDAIGWTYSQAGHTFYVLELPTSGRTLVYDAATNRWHERSSGLAGGAWRARQSVSAFGKILVGDSQAGNVAELDLNTYAELGGTLRSAASAAIVGEHKRRFMASCTLEYEAGVGLSTGQGSAPGIMLRISNDGGRTWGGEKTALLGGIGDYRQSARWDRLGSFRGGSRAMEFAISDPIKRAIYGIEYELAA